MRNQHYAVVVGIDYYPLFHSNLGGPVHDAGHFIEWLTTAEDQGGAAVPENNITSILVPVPVADPTHPEVAHNAVPAPVVENILLAFEDLRRKVQDMHRDDGLREERLYIFMAGHGFSVDTEQLGIEESVLLMSNAEEGNWPHFAGHYCAEWFVRSGLFKEVVLFMDCCRNEPRVNFPLSLPSWGVGAHVARAKKFYGFATKWDKPSREQAIDDITQGVFTWALLKALRGDVTDALGQVTETELKGSIYNSVRKLLAGGQDPAFEGDDNWVFTQIVSRQRPTATIQIDFGQLASETSVELVDASHTLIEKRIPRDGPWQRQLQPGFYLLQVPVTGQRTFFDITGSDPRTISLGDEVVQERHDDATGKVHLVADAGDPTTEIFVIDGHFQRIKEGITGGHGHLEVDLDPGIYKLKYVAGSLTQEKYVSLQGGSNPVVVPAPALRFSTSVPLKQTRTTQDYHEDNANKVSKHIHAKHGSGSQLFVFVRDLEKQGSNDPATGLTLHDLEGNRLVDFTKSGKRDILHPEIDHWIGCTVQLTPGAYRLRVQSPVIDTSGNTDILEQIVITSKGWQTQVFLLRKPLGDPNDSQTLRANLGDASIFMVPIGTGFQPERPGFREAELARQGIIRGRTVLEASELGRMIWRDHKNPMLGIYGAHQLLLSEKLEATDLELLRHVADILRGMIGPHPDVLALDAFLNDRATNDPISQTPGYRIPPMLRSSWNILVKASIAHPEIIRADSLASSVADHIWGDGTWLVWQGSTADGSHMQPIEPLDVSTLHFAYPQIVNMLNTFDDKPILDFVKENNLSNRERFLLEYIALSRAPVGADQVPGEVQSQAWARENLTMARLVQALHMPSASIDEAIGGLLKKLQLNPF